MSNITIRKKLSSLQLTQQYFQIVGCLNNIPLSEGETQLLWWVATYGYPKKREQKQEYFSLFKKSEPALNNLVFFLKKKGFLIKEEKSILLNPVLNLNTQEALQLNIVIEYEQ